MRIKPIIYSIFVVVPGLTIYWHLYTGGWLTNPYYHWNDPDIVNLLLAIIEPILLLLVPWFWLRPSRLSYRMLFLSFVLQFLICAGFTIFFAFFFMTWKPRLM